MGGLGVAGGQAQGFLGLALLQQPAQQAGQHWLALRQGVEAGVLSMGVRCGLLAGCTAGHALCYACTPTFPVILHFSEFVQKKTAAYALLSDNRGDVGGYNVEVGWLPCTCLMLPWNTPMCFSM